MEARPHFEIGLLTYTNTRVAVAQRTGPGARTERFTMTYFGSHITCAKRRLVSAATSFARCGCGRAVVALNFAPRSAKLACAAKS